MSNMNVLAIDLAKDVFQLIGTDKTGNILLKKGYLEQSDGSICKQDGENSLGASKNRVSNPGFDTFCRAVS